ncbi:MAG TPA: glycosyltransferase family 4 protein [Dehalococcoidia bacterium]|nr:glycosyltransferase family 4 protein [Dehalococcoidia bacterium]
MARVLVLSSFPVYPANDGGRVRAHQVAASLAGVHDVTVVCPRLADPVPGSLPYRLRDIAGAGPRRQLLDPPFLRRLVAIVREERPDAIVLEYVWQGLHATLASALTATPLIVDAFDVLRTRFRRAHHPLWPVVAAYERAVLARARQVLAISPRDLEEFARMGIARQRLLLVPGGVDAAAFHPDEAARARTRAGLGVIDATPLLLFFGQLEYAPNAEALRLLCSEIMPRLDDRHRLVVAGRGRVDPAVIDAAGGRARVLGPVDRIADYINAADAVVAPLRSGSGVRFKLLETVACGVPAVTTAVGAEGLSPSLIDSHVVIRDDWPSFAAAAEAVCHWPRSAPSREFLAAHDWRRIAAAVRI